MITITRQAGLNAVLDGVFIDSTSAPTPTATASFLEQDTTTQGSWIGTYGGQGYDIISAAPTQPPAYATRSPASRRVDLQLDDDLDRSSRVARFAGSTNRRRDQSGISSTSAFTVDVNLADGLARNLELYFLDWDNLGRGEQVQIGDAGTGQRCSTPSRSHRFRKGLYLNWKVSAATS